ncbi:schlafen-like protein 1 [Saccostrea echinata]|uniref:schlafen-like protein 1 n=1 Tax=Saccostrea echinata TaxID=191078 RepID=UPI002A8200D2|nr:schlafen-like protein 1 [Saccostrea echinata]
MVSIDKTKVYLGNLRKDIPSKDLKDHINALFNNLSIKIKHNDISIHENRRRESKHAFVDCYEEQRAKYALDQLDTWKSRGQKHTHFNRNAICRGSEPLTYGYKQIVSHKNKITPEERNRKAGDSHFPDTRTSDALTRVYHDQHQQHNHHNSLLTYNGTNNTPGTLGITGEDKQSQRKFYLEGEKLGNETRYKEFKKSCGGSDKKDRKELLSKYVCAFRNSGQGGTLYLGVDDSGSVEGVSCSQAKEDELRLEIDEAIKSIYPPIFTDAYDVKFTPVMKKSEIRKGDYKVIEIIVHVRDLEGIHMLSSSPHGTFLRREGGVQKLNDTEIQEWVMQKDQKIIRQMEEKMKEQKEFYERKIQDELKRKSKVCVVL